MLIEPGDRVLVEEPSYLAALQAFVLAGAVVVPVACDGDGLDPDAVAAAAAEHGARLLYTIPTFHNPTGRTLPLERRRALAAVAERHGLWLIEDDPYGELRYRGEPLPSLATMAEDRTLALSTLSKVAAPGLRIGWVRTPPGLRHALVVAKQAADLHSSTVDQAAAARWLAHRRPRRSHRRPARRVRPPPRRAARRAGGGAAAGLDPQPPRGRHVRLGAAAGRLGRRAAAGRALERDVAFVPGYPFFAGEPDRATLRFSFTTHAPAEIAEGLARLRRACRMTGPAAGRAARGPAYRARDTVGAAAGDL